MSSRSLNFDALVVIIQETHQLFLKQASKAVNVILTARNWLIGYYIAEYELQGADRAGYGEALLSKLADRLNSAGLKRMKPVSCDGFVNFITIIPKFVSR